MSVYMAMVVYHLAPEMRRSNVRPMRGLRILLILTVVVALAPLARAPEARAASLGLIPNSGPPGTNVDAVGGGWKANDQVDIYFDSRLVGSATVNPNSGGFSVPFTVPSNPQVGEPILTPCTNRNPPRPGGH